MPVLPTIADTFRMTWNWNLYQGVKPRNVMHWHAPGLSEAQIFTAWQARWLPNMVQSNNTAQAITTVDILKLDGVSATQTFAVTITNAHGSTNGDITPEAALVLSLRTLQRGSRGRGRLFIGPIAEAAGGNGVVESTYVSQTNAAWGTFVANMSTDGAALCIASYVHADQHHVVSLHADSGMGTQRRRLLQQR